MSTAAPSKRPAFRSRCAWSARSSGYGCTVTANTRQDAREFLGFAAEHKLKVTVHPYPLDRADQALRDLKAGRFDGAAVLIP